MLASWCHQVPMFFLHHLQNQSSSASEEGTEQRIQCEQCFPVLCSMHPCEDPAGVLSIPACSWKPLSHLCFSLQGWQKMLLSPKSTHSFGASLYLHFAGHMDSCNYKGTWKVQSFSGTLPSQIKLSLFTKKERENE